MMKTALSLLFALVTTYITASVKEPTDHSIGGFQGYRWGTSVKEIRELRGVKLNINSEYLLEGVCELTINEIRGNAHFFFTEEAKGLAGVMWIHAYYQYQYHGDLIVDSMQTEYVRSTILTSLVNKYGSPIETIVEYNDTINGVYQPTVKKRMANLPASLRIVDSLSNRYLAARVIYVWRDSRMNELRCTYLSDVGKPYSAWIEYLPEWLVRQRREKSEF